MQYCQLPPTKVSVLKAIFRAKPKWNDSRIVPAHTLSCHACVDWFEEDNVREGFLEHNQYVILRDELPDHQRLILVIGYHLGMRRGEILKLLGTSGLERKPRPATEKADKGKKARIAPLYGELRAWLDMAYTSRDPACSFIVARQGHRISEVKTARKKACERANFPELLVHDLRRTAARNMLRPGIPEKQIMLIAGWKTRSMFDRYHIVDERDIHEAGKKLARHLEEKAHLLKEGTADFDENPMRSRKSESVQ